MSIKSLRACIVKKQISSLARVRAAGVPQALAQELHFPLRAVGTELQRLTTPTFESITCGGDWSTCNAPIGRGAVGPRGVSRRSGTCGLMGSSGVVGIVGGCGRNLMLAAF